MNEITTSCDADQNYTSFIQQRFFPISQNEAMHNSLILCDALSIRYFFAYWILSSAERNCNVIFEMHFSQCDYNISLDETIGCTLLHLKNLY